jgi:hypothetical protein
MGDKLGGFRGEHRRSSNGGCFVVAIALAAFLAAAYVVGSVVGFPSWWPW